MTLSREEEMQAITDALGAIVTIIARQGDAERVVADLKLLANAYFEGGKGPSAGLIDTLARTVEVRALGKAGEH